MNLFSAWDYWIVVAYLLGILAIGLAFSGRQTSLREYFLASGNLPWWAVAVSLYATALSPLSYLGVTSWIYVKDSRWIIGGNLVGIATVLLAALLWVPLWSRLQMLSIYEYLERRYHPSLRTFGAGLFPFQMVFWQGNALVASAMAFGSVTGVPSQYCLIVIVLLGTVYTAIGGTRAVVWTDVAQFVVFVFGFIVIGLTVLSHFAWDPIRIYAIASKNISQVTHYPTTQLFSTETSIAIESTIWAIIFVRLMDVLLFGTSQLSMQRLLATAGRRNMIKAMFGSMCLGLLFSVILTLSSWGIVAFYAQNPQMKAMVSHPDQVVAQFTVGFVPVVARGLIMAGLMAAMMSSFDSVLNALTSVSVNDFYKRYLGSGTEEHEVKLSKYLTVVWGAILLLFALWQLDHSKSTVIERVGKLNALLASPLACFFVLGVFSRRCNTGGVLIGGIAGMLTAFALTGFPGLIDHAPASAIATALMSLWSQNSGEIHPRVEVNVNWMWIGGFSMLVSFIVGYLSSLLFKAPSSDRLQGLTVYATPAMEETAPSKPL